MQSNSKLSMQYLNTLLIAVLGSLSKIKPYLTCKCNPHFWLAKFLCSVFFTILLKPAINKKILRLTVLKHLIFYFFSRQVHSTEYANRNVAKKKGFFINQASLNCPFKVNLCLHFPE